MWLSRQRLTNPKSHLKRSSIYLCHHPFSEGGKELVHNQALVPLPGKKLWIHNKHLSVQRFGKAGSRPINEIFKAISDNDVEQLTFPNQVVVIYKFSCEKLIEGRNCRNGNQTIEQLRKIWRAIRGATRRCRQCSDIQIDLEEEKKEKLESKIKYCR